MRVAPMNSRFLDACRRRPTDVRPVWFMRQAGRYMKQYRDIRQHHGILEICKRPDLAAEVTLQPVEILDVDAAIIFADLLLPVEPMGLRLRFAPGEGPVIENPVRTSSDIDSLSISNTDDLGYVGESIQQVVKALAGRVPVIGFVGAPFTMASYMIEGGPSRNFLKTKQMMYRDETLWRRLMGKLVDVLGSFAVLQVAAGARIIQVFDSWVGALGPDDYVRYVAPYSRALIERIRAASVPSFTSELALRDSSASCTPPEETSWASIGASTSIKPGWISATVRRCRAIWTRRYFSRRFRNCARAFTNC